ncbi:MAG: hypothetical protein HYZ53_00520 [Planctomycetes bacterium]|nr:hypothetical protein [Planctomycetota bacterium]
MKRIAWVGLVAVALFATAVAADNYRLKTGGSISGETVGESDTDYSVKTKMGTIKVQKSDVVSVEKAEVDETADLKEKLKGVVSLAKDGKFLRARKGWDGLSGVRSPAWKRDDLQGSLLGQAGWEVAKTPDVKTFAAFVSYLDARAKEQCAGCEGEGALACEPCLGRGLLPCPACQGKPHFCEKCQRQGSLKCPTCKGTGSERCASCEKSERPGYVVRHETKQVLTGRDYSGNPQYSNQSVTTADPCPTCKGSARLPCSVCLAVPNGAGPGEGGKAVKGKLRCDACGGTGRLPCTANCDNGVTKEKCAACGGKGKKPCAACAGSGKAAGSAGGAGAGAGAGATGGPGGKAGNGG